MKRVSTRHRMQVKTWIELPLIPLESWHKIIARDVPTPYVPWVETSYLA